MRSMGILALTALALLGCNNDEGDDGTDPGKFANAQGFAEGVNGEGLLENQDYSITDEFTFYVSPVDVLFIIDDSCSMQEEQESLNVGFPGFFSLLEVVGDQYHIGVISTDMDDPQKSGKLQTWNDYRWIDADTEEPFEVFARMSRLGTSGSGTEKGILATYEALETLKDTDNAGFYREEAALMAVVLSDEPDFTDPGELEWSEFRDWLGALKPEAEPGWLTFNGIIGPPPSGCSGAGGDAAFGDGYMQMIEYTGGVAHSICETPYGPAFDEMIGQIPSEEFFLSTVPDASSIRISAVGPDGTTTYLQDDEWQYFPADNYITLNNALKDESQVYVRYLPLSLLAQ